MKKLALVVLIQLHGLDGAAIYVNPQQITSLRAAADHKHFTEKAACMIGLTDGKFVTVLDDCATVRKLMEDKR